MKNIRSIITLGCLAAIAATAGAQGYRPGTGITDIMRAGPRLGPPPARPSTAPAAAPVQRSAEFIVALVNSEPITNTDVQSRVTRLIKENPDAERVPRGELTRLVLERLITERAQLQLAKENGIKVDEVAIDQAEQTVARQNEISLVELRRRVAAEGIAQQDFRNDLRDQLLLTRLRDREVESKVKISDAEADEYLRDQRNQSVKNVALENLNLAQVLVAVPENATDAQVAAAQKKAQDIAQRARAGEDFAKLVRENSDSPDRGNGGAIGMRSADRYPSLFVEATQSTAVNGIAGPVRSSAGFHVLKVLAKAQIGSGDATVTQTQVRHILLLNDPKRTTAQAVAQLAEFKRRIQAGTADFAGLARDNSQDGSAKQGGDLGWSRPGQFVPEFEEAMDRLSPGQISDPVVSRFGVHLIQVVARRDSKLSQSEQREAARAALREQRVEEAFTTWVQEVRARAYVEYREPPQS
ncbi:peptidylprolyl isomerase [Variovorax atrisoli]|jgi:peptidyl-prolyl cis-trans isomerase SurA|uniref:peptidylprolyl isomerase n=1 Tax=Variovorax atrisoli TaxID=3394203 RepID=UPI00119C52C0|nr:MULTISPECIES: peptidylprolyl isomerase [Variovorax]MBB3640696.1 peptidyl-prolyl cis-trans isomerase SurA [Variovorax sp. BK613]MDR6520118.1 peptidyl-prolyl cis-trans isomerase SurA [Variovorax paradoxus]